MEKITEENKKKLTTIVNGWIENLPEFIEQHNISQEKDYIEYLEDFLYEAGEVPETHDSETIKFINGLIWDLDEKIQNEFVKPYLNI